MSRQSDAAVTALALVALMAIALWTRLQFIAMYGGHEPSYLSWSKDHCVGYVVLLENSCGYAVDDSAANHVIAPLGYTWASIEGNASDRLQPLFFGRVHAAIDLLGLLALIAAVWLVRRDPLSVALLVVLPLYALGSIGLAHYEARYVRYVPVAYVLGLALICSKVCSAAVGRRRVRAVVVVVLLCPAGGAHAARELIAIRTAANSGIVQP